MTWIKICGITTPEDAEMAIELGASAIGMIFAPSRREVTIDRARGIAEHVRGRAEVVGVFKEIETVRAVRQTVGDDFPVSVKLNSDDFRKGGFSHEDCLAVVARLNHERIDLLEISGGTYEQPRLLGVAGRQADAVEPRPSTQAREAYFLDYAAAIRRVATMPLMVTGGFRSRAGMEAALRGGDTDMIGIARPFCTDPDCARRLLRGEIDTLPAHEAGLHLARSGWLSPASPLMLFKVINVIGAQGWYYQQMDRLAVGRPPELGRGVLRSFLRHLWDELTRASKLQR